MRFWHSGLMNTFPEIPWIVQCIFLNRFNWVESCLTSLLPFIKWHKRIFKSRLHSLLSSLCLINISSQLLHGGHWHLKAIKLKLVTLECVDWFKKVGKDAWLSSSSPRTPLLVNIASDELKISDFSTLNILRLFLNI
jgi:hypothetical protein